MASAASAQRRVLPSISVIRKVTTPVGGSIERLPSGASVPQPSFPDEDADPFDGPHLLHTTS